MTPHTALQEEQRIRKLIEQELWTGDVLPYDGITRLAQTWDQELTFSKEQAVQEERERIKNIITTKLNLSKMLPGWERYWVNMGNGGYVEQCQECELSRKIIIALTPPNTHEEDY